jgi:hypothetical protein
MEAQEILEGKILKAISKWRIKAFEQFKANCKICSIPLQPHEARFTKLDESSFFCERCWKEKVLPQMRAVHSIASGVEKDVTGMLYGIVFHSDLLQSDEDFAMLGKYVAAVMKEYVSKLIDAGLDPDTVMSYWPVSLFRRLTGIALPSNWADRFFAASVIEDVVRYHTTKGLFIFTPDGKYWKESFRAAPAAYALRKEPLRKIQPEELLELLRQEHR